MVLCTQDMKWLNTSFAWMAINKTTYCIEGIRCVLLKKASYFSLNINFDALIHTTHKKENSLISHWIINTVWQSSIFLKYWHSLNRPGTYLIWRIQLVRIKAVKVWRVNDASFSWFGNSENLLGCAKTNNCGKLIINWGALRHSLQKYGRHLGPCYTKYLPNQYILCKWIKLPFQGNCLTEIMYTTELQRRLSIRVE